jgi:hypothetical protein
MVLCERIILRLNFGFLSNALPSLPQIGATNPNVNFANQGVDKVKGCAMVRLETHVQRYTKHGGYQVNNFNFSVVVCTEQYIFLETCIVYHFGVSKIETTNSVDLVCYVILNYCNGIFGVRRIDFLLWVEQHLHDGSAGANCGGR